MIDLTKLTQEQQWGLSYALKLANEARVQQNLSLPVANKLPMLTNSQYAESMFRSACDSYYTSLIDVKRKSAMEKFNALPPAQQAALLTQLQVPDVLT